MKFKKSYFTKESFQSVGLDIDKAYRLTQFLKPLIELYKRDGIFLEFNEMKTMLTGYRQNCSNRNENLNNFLFIKWKEIDDTMYYIVNKNFDWNWYNEHYYKEERFKEIAVTNSKASINELELLRIIANMINKEFKENYGLYKETLPNNIVMAMNIWNEKFNQ